MATTNKLLHAKNAPMRKHAWLPRKRVYRSWPIVVGIMDEIGVDVLAKKMNVSDTCIRAAIKLCLFRIVSVNALHQKGKTDFDIFKEIGATPRSIIENQDWWKETKAIYDKHWQDYDDVENVRAQLCMDEINAHRKESQYKF